MGSFVRSVKVGALGVAGALLLALGVVVPGSSAVGADTTVANVTVHDAQALPFATGVLTTPPDAGAWKVSCPADGECVASGAVATAGTPVEHRAFVSVQHLGVWGPAQLVEFPGDPSFGTDSAWISAFECVAPGECVGLGRFDQGTPPVLPFMVSVTGGVVQSAIWLIVPGPQWLAIDPNSIACTAPGQCVALGDQMLTTGAHLPVEWSITDGLPAPGVPITLPASLSDPVSPDGNGLDIECPAAGACVELGWAGLGSPTPGQMWVRVQSAGVWGSVQTVAFDPGSVSPTGMLVSGILECWGVGSCTVIGSVPLVARDGLSAPYSAAITGGVLGAPALLATPGYVDTITWYVQSATCSGPGACLASVSGFDTAGSTYAGSAHIEMTDGVWSIPVDFANPREGWDSFTWSVSCVRPGSCAVIGYITKVVGGVDESRGVLQIQRDGVWQQPVVIGAPAELGDSTDLMALSCVARGTTCVAVGIAGDGGLVPGEVTSGMLSAMADPSNAPTIAPDPGTWAIAQLTEFITPTTPKFTG